jgi:hypothetical protein
MPNVIGRRSRHVDDRDRAAFQALLDALMPRTHETGSHVSAQEAGKILEDLLAQHRGLESDVLRGLRKAANAAVADAMDELARTDEPAWEAVRLVTLAAFYQQPDVLRRHDGAHGLDLPLEPPAWLVHRPIEALPLEGTFGASSNAAAARHPDDD